MIDELSSLVIRRASLTVSAFNFVDLTGSERVKKAGTDRNKGMLKEGTMINKSLVTLGICIRELGKPGGGGFVPYRYDLRRESSGRLVDRCVTMNRGPNREISDVFACWFHRTND